KAWQAITHPSSLPTWKRIKDRGLYSEKYGLLKPTPENLEAWNRVVEVCQTLGARIAVVQTPPSFNLSPENCRNAQSFFKEASRRGVIIAWEPRGDWLDSPGKVSEICREFGLLPVVDLLRREAITVSNLCYTRLHGLNPREYDYHYAYGDDDLKRLLGTLNKLEGEGVEEAYVLFNNLSMFNDASRFHGMVERSSL
ncbi:MAG: DUF72 domain-containing protein, partial [Candidatus Bathyarchaeia archaeon]